MLAFPKGSEQVKDFFERHYGDMVAIMMIGTGSVILMVCRDQQCVHLGERLTGAGLLALRLMPYKKESKGEGDGPKTGAMS